MNSPSRNFPIISILAKNVEKITCTLVDYNSLVYDFSVFHNGVVRRIFVLASAHLYVTVTMNSAFGANLTRREAKRKTMSHRGALGATSAIIYPLA